LTTLTACNGGDLSGKDVTERQLREAPAFARQGEHDWSDLNRDAELDAYYNTPPHLHVI
jgi:hypothetical protein